MSPSADWSRVSALLDAVFDLAPDECAAYLDDACDDDDVRAEVEALLAAEADAPSFLEEDAAAVASPLLTDEEREEDADGAIADEHVGPYRLVERIGSGGMSVVYRAERADGHFDQQVALKLLPRYFETERRIARFRAERQILAALDHPNIARLLDGGVTDTGRPYLVMEYVDGVPITEYCAGQDLSLRTRLDLLQTVCRAVQHAHQRLVVHRDLKPANILVASSEDGPRVKLLDFGIAKLLDETEATWTLPVTRTGEHWMTPEYAAPEQVRGEAITTATDVYQLGVLAYELLTEQRPFDLSGKPLTEVERIVLTVDPQRPSTQVDRPHVSTQKIEGDLDTIVIKALRKEPDRRYPSAEALAEDLERYTSGRPVRARPATWHYRARKFIRRNRGAMLAAATIAALVIAYAVTITIQAQRIAHERNRAQAAVTKAERVTEFMTGILSAEDPRKAQGDTVTVREVLNAGIQRIGTNLSDQPDLQATLYLTTGRVYRSLGDYPRADSLLERAVAVRRATDGDAPSHELAAAERELGLLRKERGTSDAAVTRLQRALEQERALHDGHHPHVASDLVDLAEAYREQKQYDEAEPLYHQAIALYRQLPDTLDSDLAITLNNLGLLYHETGQYEQAAPLYREALAKIEAALGARHPYTATLRHNRAGFLRSLGRYAASDSLFRRVVAIDRIVQGPDHPYTAVSLGNLGMTLNRRGAYQAADSVLTEAVRILVKRLGPTHSMTRLRMESQAYAWVGLERYAAADSLFERLYTMQADDADAAPGTAVDYHQGLAYIDQQQNCLDAAAAHLKTAWTQATSASGSHQLRVLRDMADVFRAQRRLAPADTCLQRALRLATPDGILPDWPAVLVDRAFIALDRDELSAASTHLTRADSIITATLPEGTKVRAQWAWARSRLAGAQNRPRAAQRYAKVAAAWHRRNLLPSHPDRRAFDAYLATLNSPAFQ